MSTDNYSTTSEMLPRCYPGNPDPRCPQTTTQPPLRCYPGNPDPRCPQTTTEPPLRCYPGNPDPRCPQTTTQPPLRCYPGNPDPRCPQTTTEPPLRCYPGNPDPRCPQAITQPPLRCYPGSPDPRCPQTTTPPPTYIPPPATTTPFFCPCLTQSTTTPKPSSLPVCYPGSLDPRCAPTATTQRPTTTRLICYPGSPDPRCPTTTTQRPTTTRLSCYPGSPDPRCPTPTTTQRPTTTRLICYPGSPDPRCPTTTTTQRPTTTRLRCYPGSPDPRCPTPTTSTSTPGPTYLPPTELPPGCFPGSSEKICIGFESGKVITQVKPPRCFPGTNDPSCYSEDTDSSLIISEGRTTTVPPPNVVTSSVTKQREDGDFHGKDQDPRYHAFHSYLYEPRKPSTRRRNYGKRDVEDALTRAHLELDQDRKLEKRSVDEKQVVSITLGVRGLMVGSEKDLLAHAIRKREVNPIPEQEIVEPKARPSSVSLFSSLNLTIGAAILSAVLMMIGYVYLQKRRNSNKLTQRVVTVHPELRVK
uniref:Uncharacterized protein n=1 Tax=Timema bartmani TaxID=61472 RepID=A0A7R9EWY3_9NEOP|nr:unnamed protein product [Timema bartmani]